MASMDKVLQIQEKASKLQFQYWQEEVYLSPQWWFLLFSLIAPWFLFWLLFDRNQAFRTWIVGLFIMLTSFFLDEVGASFQLWEYPYTLTPLEREVFDPANFTLLPIVYMLVYQYTRSWKGYLISLIFVALFNTYIGGGLFRLIGAYELVTWKSIYSVPIYYLLGVLARYFVQCLEKLQHQNKTSSST